MGRFRAAPLACLVLFACGCERAAVEKPPPPSEGMTVYTAQSCGSCHGQARRGSTVAPPLVGLAAKWTEETLTVFLRDPASYRSGRPRLEEEARRWPAEMPPIQLADEVKLRGLVRFLLESGPAAP